ncbi:tetratricopeptide repeat protein [Geminicoccus flavidas]|uniref:tetratricopeptide repeat protein n=1 Tax=Geminicoccus flavidas TaxID=2506407 RepID=UPI0038B3D416
MLLRRTGDAAPACRALEELLGLLPDHPAARIELTQVLAALGDFAQAAAVLAQQVRQWPAAAAAWQAVLAGGCRRGRAAPVRRPSRTIRYHARRARLAEERPPTHCPRHRARHRSCGPGLPVALACLSLLVLRRCRFPKRNEHADGVPVPRRPAPAPRQSVLRHPPLPAVVPCCLRRRISGRPDECDPGGGSDSARSRKMDRSPARRPFARAM